MKIVWNSLWDNKYEPTDITAIKSVLYDIGKALEQWRANKFEQESLNELERKSLSRLAALELLKDSLTRCKEDQSWIYKSVVTRVYEYLPLNSTDMLIKSECIKLVQAIIDPKNIDSFLIKPGYLFFHEYLLSILASGLDPSKVNPSLISGLASPTVYKWDIGLWKFSYVGTDAYEYASLMNTRNYARLFQKVIGPKVTLNTEWLLTALCNSFKLVGDIFAVYNKMVNVSITQVKPTMEMVYKAFALFQALSELKVPVMPWEVTRDQWNAETHKKIVECKGELLKIINLQAQAKSPLAQVKGNPQINACVAKGITDVNDVESLKFSFETLVENLRIDPRFIESNFNADQVVEVEKNACEVMNGILCEQIGREIMKINELRIEFENARLIEKESIKKLIKGRIDRINSEGAHVGTMILSVLTSCLKQGLRCIHNQDSALKLANSYLNFINTIKSAQKFLFGAFPKLPDLTAVLEQLSKLRQNLDLKALYIFSVVARTKECATLLGRSSLLTHFISDCKSVVCESVNSVFVTSVLLYYILLHSDDISLLLRNQDGLLPLISQLVKSSNATMESLCVLVKIIKMLIDILPANFKKVLREAIPVLTAFMTNSYPQILKSDKGVFGTPEMLIAEAWENMPGMEGYTGHADLLRDVKHIIEVLSPIKPEVLSGAKASIEKKVNSQQKGDGWIGPAELVKLRKEMYEILLKNKGQPPSESKYEEFTRYNNLLARIKRYEEDKPTILDEIDKEYKELVKAGLIN